jgi:MFS family permease
MLRTYFQRLRALQRNARLFLLSNAVINVATGALSLLYGIFLTRLGYGTDFLSVLLVVGIAGAGLGLIPALLIADRYSIRSLLIWSNLIGGVAAAGQLLIPQAPVLIATTFVVGASASIYIVLTPPLLTATSTEIERTHLFSLNATLGSLTLVAGSLLGGFLPNIMGSPLVLRAPFVAPFRPLLVHGDALPLQLALLVAGVIAIPSLWPLLLMDDAVAQTRERAVAGVARADWRAWLRRYLHPDALRRFVAWRGARFAAYQAILGLGAGLFLTYINLYFVNHLHISTATYGIISSASTILLAVATLGAPLLAERFGSVRGPVSAQMLSVPLLLGLAFLTKVPVVAAFYLLRATLMNLGGPALQSFIMSILHPRERSAASSAFNVAFQVTAAAGGVASGFLIAHGGYALDFILAAICYASAMLLLTPWFGREARLLRTSHADAEHAGEAQTPAGAATS